MVLPTTDGITNLLTKFLDVQSRRAEVVASNLANADTPGYVAKELEFADYMRSAAEEAMNPSASQRAQGLTDAPRIIEETPGAVGIDGNTVDAGREMSTLAESGMNYLAGAQLLQSRLRTLRSAIREGR